MIRYVEWALTIAAPLPLILLSDRLHTPYWLVALVTCLNWGTAACYWRIPRDIYLDARGGAAMIERLLVPGFISFIHWCGIHHRLHWPSMTMMAAGFGMHNPWLAWGGAAIVVGVDSILLWHSATTAVAFRRAKKTLWGKAHGA